MKGTSLERIFYPLLGLVLVLSFWQLVCILWKMPTAVLPTPLDVALAIQKNWVTLFIEGWITLKATLYGFALALILGIPLAVGASSNLIGLARYWN